MRKTTYIAVTALAAMLIAAAAAMPAAAKSGPRVLKSGKCSQGSTWTLKAHLDDGRIETEFEVDQNRVGRRWRVTLVRNGRTVFTGIRRTVAPSGSFELRRLLGNSPGTDRITGRARALAGGETCVGSLSL